MVLYPPIEAFFVGGVNKSCLSCNKKARTFFCFCNFVFMRYEDPDNVVN
jgi:hypothetical protein